MRYLRDNNVALTVLVYDRNNSAYKELDQALGAAGFKYSPYKRHDDIFLITFADKDNYDRGKTFVRNFITLFNAS